ASRLRTYRASVPRRLRGRRNDVNFCIDGSRAMEMQWKVSYFIIGYLFIQVPPNVGSTVSNFPTTLKEV
ncbi:MAG: hypothetical protein OEV24_16025, partial [Cyclobacteriaceae bacterium]|nr:hypothetical protein [Cyclobacteriaceae bacterium]